MEKLTKAQIEELYAFNSPRIRHFKKRGRFLYRGAIKGETIITMVGGKVESIKTADCESFVVRNIEIGSSGEQYIVDFAVFMKRYEIIKENYIIDGKDWGLAIAKGEINAFHMLALRVWFIMKHAVVLIRLRSMRLIF